MVVRQAGRSDLAHIAALHTESCRDTYRDVFPKDWLNDPIADVLQRHWNGVQIRSQDILLVAENKSIVGFIAVWCRPDPFIANLHVAPGHRSLGIGSTLIRSAASRLIRRGHRSVYLWVVASNQAAITFYEHLGGVRSGTDVHDVFGHRVAEIKMIWEDLSVLCPDG